MAALLLTAALVLGPGVLVGRAAGIRWLTVLTAAPLVSFGLVAVISLFTTATALPWNPITFGTAVLVLAAVAWALRRLLPRTALGRRLPGPGRPEPPLPRRSQALVLGAAALAGLIGGAITIWGMGGLAAVNQGFDAIFHVNAVALIARTGVADPASMGALNHFDYGATYYPDGFHALAALVAEAGIAPVVATNALVAAIPAVLCAGLAGLLWQLGFRRQALIAPFVAICSTSFPTDSLWRGPVWPYALGVALIPAMLHVLVGAFERRDRRVAGLSAVGAAGLLLVHPSAALAAAIFAAAYFGQRWLTRQGRFRADVVPLLAISAATVVLALPAVLTALANTGYGESYNWPAVQTPGAAVGDLLLFGYVSPQCQFVLAALLLAGLIAARRLARLAWWLAGGAVFVVLMVMAAAYEGPLVALLTGPWWNDRFRFVALAVLILDTLCAHGLVVLAERSAVVLDRLAARARPRWPRPGPVVALVALLGVFTLVTGGFYADRNHSRLQMRYAMGSTGAVTRAELAAMDHLATLVGPGQVVMNDPGDGSGWMWALHGIRPMFGQPVLDPIRPPLEPEVQTALDGFDCLDSSPAVRQVVQDYDIHYVFVGDSFIFTSMHRAEGLQSLAQSRSLRLVFDNGGAQIYQVVLAPLVPPGEDVACATAGHPSERDW